MFHPVLRITIVSALSEDYTFGGAHTELQNVTSMETLNWVSHSF